MRLRHTVLVTLLAVEALAGCARPAPPRPHLQAPTGGGVILGIDVGHHSMELFELSTTGQPPRRFTRIARGISWVTANAHRLVVSSPLNGFDRVSEYTGSSFRIVEDRPSYLPTLARDGSLAYTRLVDEPANHVEVVVAEPGNAPRVLGSAVGDALPAWGGPQRLAVLLEAGSEGARIELFDTGTGEVLSTLNAPWAQNIFWAPGQPVAYNTNSAQHSGGVIDPATGVIRQLPPGWYPLTWGPLPSQLLATDRSRLAVVDPRTPSRIHPLPGTAPGPIRQAVWSGQPPRITGVVTAGRPLS